ncbi:MAG: DUF6524 family protein [Rhodovibrionaceae bacterium]
MARANRFSFPDFLLRWGFSLILVFATFNPSGYAYANWLLGPGGFEEDLPLKALAGVLLLIGWVIFLRATWRSIGILGIVLAAAVVGALAWVLADFGLLDPQNPKVMTWLGLFIISWVLAIGISWSHIRRRVSGQLDVDDVEE